MIIGLFRGLMMNPNVCENISGSFFYGESLNFGRAYQGKSYTSCGSSPRVAAYFS